MRWYANFRQKIARTIGQTGGAMGKPDAQARSHMAWLVSSNAFQVTLGFLVNLALVRLISPSEFGYFAIVSANITLVCLVVNFRVPEVLVRTPPERMTPHLLAGMGTVSVIQAVLSGSAALIMLIVNDTLNINTIVFLLSLIANVWVTLQTQLQVKYFEIKQVAKMEMTSYVCSHFVTLGLAAAGFPAAALFYQNATRLAVNTVMLVRAGAWRKLGFRMLTREDFTMLTGTFRGLWIDGLFEQAMERIVLIFVGLAAGTAGAGYFVQAKRLALVPGQFIDPLASRYSFAYFANKVTADRRIDVLRRSFLATIVVLGAVMVVIVVGAPLLIPFVYGEPWRPVVPILIGLGGLIAGATLMGLMKSHYYSTFNVRRLVLLGRIPYAASFLVIATVLWLTGVGTAFYVALALSFAYLFAVALLAADSFIKRNRPGVGGAA